MKQLVAIVAPFCSELDVPKRQALAPINGNQPKNVLHTLGFKIDDDGALLLDPVRVAPFPDNPRKRFRGIPALAESIKEEGQTQPGLVKILKDDPHYDVELIDGERRLRACRLLLVRNPNQKFRAFPTFLAPDKKKQRKRSFVSNFCRDGHDCMEIAHAIKDLLDDGETQESIAKLSGGKSQAWVSQHLSFLKLHPDIQKMIVPGENGEEAPLTPSLAFRLTEYTHENQLKALRDINLSENEKPSMVQVRRRILDFARQNDLRTIQRPKRQFQGLVSFAKRFSDSLGIYLDMKDAELLSIMEAGTPESRQSLVVKLEEVSKELGVLIDSVKSKTNGLTK